VVTDADARIEALAARVRALEDVEAIRRLKARYAELVDARYAGGEPRPVPELERLAGEIATLFTEDATWDGGAGLGICQGRDAIRARMAAPTLRFSVHHFVNPHIVVDGDHARARWELLAPCTLRDGRPAWMAGAEDDEYLRAGDLWLHRSMKLSVYFLAPHERGWSKPTG
jgi:hypothetical protein